MNDLSAKTCVPCRGGDPALSAGEVAELQKQIPDWEVIQEDGVSKLKREFRFKNFAQALTFTNRVGEEAERQDHHPLLITEWGKATVVWWTHSIKGLHANDFIMAAKTNKIHSMPE